MTNIIRNLIAVICCLWIVSCAEAQIGPNLDSGDSDADSDSDADTDADTDADSDGDADSDTDADADTDADTDSDSSTESDSGTDSVDSEPIDTNSDTGFDTEPYEDTDTTDDGSECTVETAQTDCAADEYCVGGYCCDMPCTGRCEACNLEGFEGTCTLLPALTSCRSAAGICDYVERCDGTSPWCPEDTFTGATKMCRESIGECDPEERCNGSGPDCPEDVVLASGTACGSSTTSNCDNADRCDSAGQCSPNWKADDTPCGTSTTTYRCSTTDCDAIPQSRTQGSSCQSGVCTAIEEPAWIDLDTCTSSEICVAGSSSATCSPCTSPPADSCNASLDSVQYVDTGTCDDSGSTPACFYASSVVDCAYPTDNCVNGICTGFTCIPAEKNESYPWDTAADDMGWTLSGNWQHASNWPYNYTEYYLQIASLNDGITTPADHVLLSPTFEFAACTGLTVNFAYWIDNNWAKCSPTKASLRLECGYGTSWTLVHEEFEMDTNNQGGFDIEADATACISEQVQFRFMVANMCAGSVNRIIVDEFRISVD